MRQPDVETWLDSIEVAWTYVDELTLRAVDEKASLRNQARLEPLDPDVVERYEADMRRGDVFPPVVARQRNDRLVILGGNHRYHAAKKAKAPLSGYVVECTDEQALRVGYEDNRRHGLPPGVAERCRQGMHLVALGWTQAAAAKVVGVTEDRLYRAVAADKFGRRCRDLEILPVPEHLSESTKARLMGVRSDPVFIDAVDLVVDAELNGDELQKLVTECNKARSESAARDHVRNVRALNADRIARKKAGGGRTAAKANPRDRLVRALTELSLLDPVEVARATLTDQRRTVFDHIRRAATALDAIDRELRR